MNNIIILIVILLLSPLYSKSKENKKRILQVDVRFKDQSSTFHIVKNKMKYELTHHGKKNSESVNLPLKDYKYIIKKANLIPSSKDVSNCELGEMRYYKRGNRKFSTCISSSSKSSLKLKNLANLLLLASRKKSY